MKRTNPTAKALTKGQHKPQVVQSGKAYRRSQKHRNKSED